MGFVRVRQFVALRVTQDVLTTDQKARSSNLFGRATFSMT
jgi:hypothetical protein